MEIKSRERVQQFGEVFTPQWMVQKMLALPQIQMLLRDINTIFIEPCSGEGAFLTEILREKLKFNPDKPFEVLRTIYGIEIQFDNLVMARKNMAEIIAAHCNVDLNDSRIWQILNHNIIRGDALKMLAKPTIEIDLFEGIDNVADTILTKVLAEATGLSNDAIKNAVIITNPPYQEERRGGNKTYSAPIYHKFIKAFYKTCNRVMVLHPARCLFNAGATPKDFNQQLLNDDHVTVEIYEPDSSKVFPNANVDVRGGVAVTYRDANKNFGKIGTFIPFDELKSIHQKVCIDNKDFKPFSKIVYPRADRRLSDKFFEDYPDSPLKNSDAIGTNAFKKLPEIFHDDKPNDGREYIQILGRIGVNRTYKWIRRDYVKSLGNLDKYKVFVPSANGSGAIGEKLSTPLVGLPLVGSTETFTGVGAFDTRTEAENCLKYIKTKFARALLGILKVTQHNPAETWAKVPLQDFTDNSDIDWSRSVDRIDLLLYKKYGLNYDEIKFIETNIKAMN